MAMLHQTLPDDIILEILSRADSVVIGRSRTLSKFWNEALWAPEFVLRHTMSQTRKHKSVIVHASYLHAREKIDSLIRILPSTGTRTYVALPTKLTGSGAFNLVGCENGMLCITEKGHGNNANILLYSMLTQSENLISYPAKVTQRNKVLMYAFTYHPMTLDYCNFHGFQKNVGDRLWGYTIYSSNTKQWSNVVACHGDLSTMGNKYCSNLGTIYWIKFASNQSNHAESVVAYSVTLDQFNNYIIPYKRRGGKHALIKYKGNVCLANIVNDNGRQHTTTLWTVSSIVDQTFKWKATLKISNLRRYVNPFFFIKSDLVCITDDCRDTHGELDAIILSRFQTNQPFARHHILCGGCGHQLQIKYVDEIVPSIYPV
ncbi:hypothetical protein PIB30_001366 [Stylosanthes scabra]|uniref:F-box domain-containing protein n=1 Tax=Stylosanthes scabra TaxID=79078 RepID=A0ABU6Y196_9FABA|nr:hypothetical protein [Stylosanthes scabra]